MALATVAEIKAYLKKQTSEEDTLITAIRLRAIAMVQAFIRRPIVAEVREMVIVEPQDAAFRSVGRVHLPIYPAEDAEVLNGDGDTVVLDDEVILDGRTGVLRGVPTYRFRTWPYTVTATVGLSLLPEYETMIEPVINAAIVDIAADLYQRRSPAATNESTGGGVSTSYAGGIPERVKDMLRPFVMARALG